MKIIRRIEAQRLGLTRYFTGRPCKIGHIAERFASTGNCIECGKLRNDYKSQWRRTNYKPHPRPLSPRIIAKKAGEKRYFTGEPCINNHISDRLVSNGQCVVCSYSRYREWCNRFPEKKKHHDNKRRARLALPQWASKEELANVYKNVPPGFVVDHIVPLIGLTVEGYEVSGLHVPWNLQYLTHNENSKKNNRMRVSDGI